MNQTEETNARISLLSIAHESISLLTWRNGQQETEIWKLPNQASGSYNPTHQGNQPAKQISLFGERQFFFISYRPENLYQKFLSIKSLFSTLLYQIFLAIYNEPLLVRRPTPDSFLCLFSAIFTLFVQRLITFIIDFTTHRQSVCQSTGLALSR